MGEREDSQDDGVYTPPAVEGEPPREPERPAQAAPAPTFVPAARLSLPVRLTITLGAALAPLALESVPLPGIDPALFRDETGFAPTANVSAGALGLMPVLSSYSLVEMVALLVPSLRRARHAGPDGRAKLHRITALVTVLLAFFQAYGINSLLRSRSLVAAGTFTLSLTMMAGTFLLWAAAQLVTRHGLGNGLVWLGAVSALRSVVVTAVAPASELPATPRAPLSTGMLAAGIAAMVAATVLVLRSATPRLDSAAARTEEAPSEARPIAIPAPSSGLAPVYMASSLLMLPATLAGLGIPGMQVGPPGDMTVLLAMVVLTAATAVTLGFLFHQPRRVAGLLGRAGVELTPSGTGGAAALVWRSMPATIGYLVGLSCASILGVGLSTWTIFPILIAWVMDAVAAHRARRAHADLVTVWTDERPFAAVVAQATLRHQGIEVVPVGLAQRSLLQFGAGYAPIELRVPAADGPRAYKVLRAMLPEPTPAASSEGEESDRPDRGEKKAEGRKKKKKIPPLPAALAPMARATLGVIAIAVVLIGLVVFVNATRPGPPGPPTAEELAQRGKILHLLRVEDDADPFKAVESGQGVPAGVRLEQENAPLGPGKTMIRYFALALVQEGEALDALEARIRPWLGSIQVPPGTHFTLGEYTEMNDEKGVPVVVGLRTFLVGDEPLLTGADVLRAGSYSERRGEHEQWSVMIELTAEGGERFRQATAANVKRRLAIVVRGRVESAPVIQQEIRGGHVLITMGAMPESEQKAKAHDLARTLSAP